MERRVFLKNLGTIAAVVPLGTEAHEATRQRDGHVLLKGGYVATMDGAIGELPEADVLFEGGILKAIGKNIKAPGARIVDARRKLVLPGLVDTHRHAWETLGRSLTEYGFDSYRRLYSETLAPVFRPRDVYIGNLLGAVGALSCGITTMLDCATSLTRRPMLTRRSRVSKIRAFGASLPMAIPPCPPRRWTTRSKACWLGAPPTRPAWPAGALTFCGYTNSISVRTNRC